MRPRAQPRPPNVPEASTPVDATRLAALLADQRTRNAAIRAQAARSAAVAGAAIDAATPLAIVPRQLRRIVPLPTAVREAFTSRLAERIRSTFDANASVPTDPSEDAFEAPHIASILVSGCTLCRGTCCTRGGDHAFLGEDSLARVRRDAPAISAQELFATYESSLPVEHVEDSCVYHGADGCTLRRAFRSNTCNRYLCGGLTQLARSLEASGGATAIIGLSDNESLLDLALVRGSAITPMAIVATTTAAE